MKEKRQLAETLPDRKLFPDVYTELKGKLPNYTYSNLGKHHLFQLLDYNPLAIRTTAMLWKGYKSFKLVTLYNMIAKAMSETNNPGMNMIDALRITMMVQLECLKDQDQSAFQFLYLVNLLPTFCALTNIETYWTEWKEIFGEPIGTRSTMQEIVEKLEAKKMIQNESKQGWQRQLKDETRIMVTESVK